MTKPPSPYVPLDMNYVRDPKIRRAGPDAELLFIRGLAYCKSGSTEGFIGAYDLDVVAIGLNKVPARVAALVREELWIQTDGGWVVKAWGRWNMSSEQIASEKAKKVASAVRTNHIRWHEKPEDFDAACVHCIESLKPSDNRS